MGSTDIVSVSFGSPEIAARVIWGDTVRVNSRSVVVNLADGPGFVEGTVRGFLPPRLSTVVDGAAVSGELLLAVGLPSHAPTEQHWRDAGWTDFYAGNGELSPGTPVLLRSPQTTVGVVEMDSSSATGGDPGPLETYEVRVNLWFSPAGTDCGIHSLHDFLEVHTQISGVGAMQKFASPDETSPYEEQFLASGSTSPAAFCRVDGQTFAYPWHQYRAVTECVWLAVEYHRER